MESVIKCGINPEHEDRNYGHLNNAKYTDYFELGRLALQKQFGISDEELKERGLVYS